MIAAAAVLIVLFIFWDAFRPAPHAVDVSEPPPATLAVDSVAHQTAPPAPAPAAQPIAPATTSSAGAAGPVVSQGLLRVFAQSPVRVWFASTHAANFKPVFLDQIRSAFGQWVNAGIPLRFDFTTDSTQAEVTVKWRIQFEIERTGQTDVTWDDQGHIQSAVVTLATFDPKGRPMEPEDIRIVAMHEVGHVLGLDHSKDSTDIMFPTAKVRDLSDRDVRTARLLYDLLPGSVR